MSKASTLANIASSVSPEAIRAVPATNTGSTVNFSAQYFFDRLVANDDSEVTKMDIVRAAEKQLSFEDFKKNVAGMVTMAKDAQKAAEVTGDAASIAKAKARYKTAQNHQTVMRNTFGALRLIPDELAALGVTATTGYQEFNVIAKTALANKGIKWDGGKAEAQDVKDARKKQAEEIAILDNLKKANPIQSGESIKDWNDRVMSMYDTAVTQHYADKVEAEVNKIAAKVMEDHSGIAELIANRILELVNAQ